MLGEFNPFHCHIKSGCVFGSWELPPPFNHLYRLVLLLCSRWRTEELEAKLTANIQNTVGANKLRDGGKRDVLMAADRSKLKLIV